MENKKLKLTVSGKSKKNLKNFTTSNTQTKRSVVIGKSQNKFLKRGNSSRPNNPNFVPKVKTNTNDFEKRRLAEQRATKRLKDDSSVKDKKIKLGAKKREVKLTVSRALSDEIEARERSLASVKRAREKENKIQNKDQIQFEPKTEFERKL